MNNFKFGDITIHKTLGECVVVMPNEQDKQVEHGNENVLVVIKGELEVKNVLAKDLMNLNKYKQEQNNIYEKCLSFLIENPFYIKRLSNKTYGIFNEDRDLIISRNSGMEALVTFINSWCDDE